MIPSPLIIMFLSIFKWKNLGSVSVWVGVAVDIYDVCVLFFESN